jgi:hypothetical protein
VFQCLLLTQSQFSTFVHSGTKESSPPPPTRGKSNLSSEQTVQLLTTLCPISWVLVHTTFETTPLPALAVSFTWPCSFPPIVLCFCVFRCVQSMSVRLTVYKLDPPTTDVPLCAHCGPPLFSPMSCGFPTLSSPCRQWRATGL